MSKIGPDRGLPADFQILQDAIDLLFNSSISSSHQNLKKFFLRKGTAKFDLPVSNSDHDNSDSETQKLITTSVPQKLFRLVMGKSKPRFDLRLWRIASRNEWRDSISKLSRLCSLVWSTMLIE